MYLRLRVTVGRSTNLITVYPTICQMITFPKIFQNWIQVAVPKKISISELQTASKKNGRLLAVHIFVAQTSSRYSIVELITVSRDDSGCRNVLRCRFLLGRNHIQKASGNAHASAYLYPRECGRE